MLHSFLKRKRRKYLPLIKALRGQGAMLEVGDMTRQSIEVVHGMIWDVFFQDSLLLLIIYKTKPSSKRVLNRRRGSRSRQDFQDRA